MIIRMFDDAFEKLCDKRSSKRREKDERDGKVGTMMNEMMEGVQDL